MDYVDRFANSSTATFPIALSAAQSEGRLGPGNRVLVATFGGGLTWGATVLQWSAPAPVRASTAEREYVRGQTDGSPFGARTQ